MIDFEKAKINFKEIENIVNKYNNLNDLKLELEKEKTYNITNDFSFSKIDRTIDFNYKNLCVTVIEKNNKLYLQDYVEIWGENDFNFLSTNIKEI